MSRLWNKSEYLMLDIYSLWGNLISHHDSTPNELTTWIFYNFIHPLCDLGWIDFMCGKLG